jgi:hypothetical protein
MKFLPKQPAAVAAFDHLSYPNDRAKAKDALMRLQHGFCAYSERYLMPLDSVEVEHFDPRLKHTESDGIQNWHAVIRWMNAHKAHRIQDYEPLPELGSWTTKRVRYERGEFVCDEEDIQTRNLIEFIGVNKPEVYEERARQVARLKRIRALCRDDETLIELLLESPEDLSYPTAIEAEMGIPAFELIERAISSSKPSPSSPTSNSTP